MMTLTVQRHIYTHIYTTLYDAHTPNKYTSHRHTLNTFFQFISNVFHCPSLSEDLTEALYGSLFTT